MMGVEAGIRGDVNIPEAALEVDRPNAEGKLRHSKRGLAVPRFHNISHWCACTLM